MDKKEDLNIRKDILLSRKGTFNIMKMSILKNVYFFHDPNKKYLLFFQLDKIDSKAKMKNLTKKYK